MEPFVYLGQYAQYHDDVAAERERLEAAAARLPYRAIEDAERAVAARFWRDKIAPRLNRQTTRRDRGSHAQARLLDGSSMARQPVNDFEPFTITPRPPAGRIQNTNIEDPVNDVSEPAWDDVVVNVDANETPGFVDPPVFPRSPLEMDRGVVAGRIARIGTRRENESANAIQQNRDALLRSAVLDGIVAGAPMATSPLRQRGIRRRTFWDGMGEIVDPVFDDVGRAWLTPEIAFDSAAPGAPVAMLAGVATSVFDEGRELYRLAQGLLTFLYNNSDVAYETAREIVGLVQEQLAELWDSDYEMGRLFAEVLIGEARDDLAEVLNPENNAYERQYYRGRLFAPVAIAIASVLLARQPGLSVVARAGSGLRRLADRIATPAFRRRVGEILRREREELGRLLSDERGQLTLNSRSNPAGELDVAQGANQQGQIPDGHALAADVDAAVANVDDVFDRMVAGTLPRTPPAPPAPRVPSPNAAALQRLYTSARTEFKRIRGDFARRLGLRDRSGGQVHHAIELDVLQRYPGVFSVSELNDFENMRGIPPERIGGTLDGEMHPRRGAKQLHNSAIRRAWNRHYRELDRILARRHVDPSDPLRFGNSKYQHQVRQYIEAARNEIDYLMGQFFSEYRSGRTR